MHVYCFYWVATGLHGVHMAIGIGLVGWIWRRARRGEFSRSYTTPVEVVGLYWSFVDLAWIAMYSLIYVAGRARPASCSAGDCCWCCWPCRCWRRWGAPGGHPGCWRRR